MAFASLGRTVALAALVLPTALTPVMATAQEQQAGNEASTNAEETFQTLIEQCDETDVLVLRARIRLLIGRASEEAAAQAQSELDEGLALCGQGDIAEAKAKLETTLANTDASVQEGFSQADGAEATSEDTASSESDAADDAAEGPPTWIWIAAIAGLVVAVGGYFMSRKSS